MYSISQYVLVIKIFLLPLIGFGIGPKIPYQLGPNYNDAAFQIAYCVLLLPVHTMAVLIKYVLLPAVCTQLGHTTSP